MKNKRGILTSDDLKTHYIQTVGSASTMLSSSTSIAKKFILDRFPKNYFKHIFTDTSLISNQQNLNMPHNKDTNKIPYPSLTITPEISIDDTYGVKNWHISDPYLGLRRPVSRNYVKLISDVENRYNLYYTAERITTLFRFKLATNTYIQNADLLYYMNSKFRRDFHQYLGDQHIETEIPKTMIKIISDIHSLNLDDDDHVLALSKIIAETSRTTLFIKRKTHQSTGKKSYFLDHVREPLILLTNLDGPSTIIREDMGEGEYIIEFTLQISINQINNFILSVSPGLISTALKEQLPTESLVESNIVLQNDDEIGNDIYVTTLTNTPLLTKTSIAFDDKFGNENVGNLIKSEVFTKFESDVDLLKFNFMDSMPEEYVNIAPYLQMVLSHKAMSKLFHFKLLTYQNELVENVDFTVDYINLSVSVDKPTTSEIKVLVYMNRLFYDLLKDHIENGTIYGNIDNIGVWNLCKDNDVNIYVPIKRLPKVWSSNNMLRIRTMKGFGFIPFKKELSEEDEVVRICIGHNKKGPMIKELMET